MGVEVAVTNKTHDPAGGKGDSKSGKAKKGAGKVDTPKGVQPVLDPTGGKGAGKTDTPKGGQPVLDPTAGKGADLTQVGGAPSPAALAGFPLKREDLMTQEEIAQIRTLAPTDRQDKPLCFGHLTHKGCTFPKCKKSHDIPDNMRPPHWIIKLVLLAMGGGFKRGDFVPAPNVKAVCGKIRAKVEKGKKAAKSPKAKADKVQGVTFGDTMRVVS